MTMEEIKKLYQEAFLYLSPSNGISRKNANVRWGKFQLKYMTKGKLRKTSKGDLVFEKFIAIVRGAIRERNEQIVKEAMKISESVIQKMLDSNSDIIIDSSIEHDLIIFSKEQPDTFAKNILSKNISLAKVFCIKREMLSFVPKNPEAEYPQALEMKRHFVLHIGPTNCGKTYHSLQALKKACNGIYLGPLRLLALEVFEKMNEENVPCSMLTGEEEILVKNSRVSACTIEMLDTTQRYDVAVIDETQMISDENRGKSWTKAILGCLANEIHVCMSHNALEMVKSLILLTGDTFEEKHYRRKTELIFQNEIYHFPKDVQSGDALIVFSKKDVLDIAGRLEKEGIKTSVIYGSLPPTVRRKQVKMYEEGKTQVVVATDVIGMGINLPIKRIVFVRTMKFDGKEVRPLYYSEIKQIAGRAGRFGLYDKGFVATMDEEARSLVSTAMTRKLKNITSVRIGFPQVLLNLNEPLNSILKTWYGEKPNYPFKKNNIDDLLYLYDKAFANRKEIPDFEDKKMLYYMISCPLDINNPDIVSLWLDYCKTYCADTYLNKPVFMELSGESRLEMLETYYKALDLYYQFAKRIGKLIDEEWLRSEKLKTEDEIISFLMKNKNNYVKKCRYCGKVLNLSHKGRICNNCYETSMARYFSYDFR